MSVARVNIWGQFAGAVSWDTVSNTAAFEFNPAFLSKKWDIAPLKMPIAEALNGRSVFSFPHLNPLTYKGLPGMLADSLPDTYGNKIIDAWLAQQGRTSESFNPVERLCYTGKRGMGALEFEPVLKVTSDVSEALEVEHLLQLARMVLNQQTQMSGNLKTATSESLQQIISVASHLSTLSSAGRQKRM